MENVNDRWNHPTWASKVAMDLATKSYVQEYDVRMWRQHAPGPWANRNNDKIYIDDIRRYLMWKGTTTCMDTHISGYIPREEYRNFVNSLAIKELVNHNKLTLH